MTADELYDKITMGATWEAKDPKDQKMADVARDILRFWTVDVLKKALAEAYTNGYCASKAEALEDEVRR